MENVFNNYLKKYDKNNSLIKKKINHSIRVMNICEILAKEMNYTNREIYLAKIIGLFHDIGCFKQISEYEMNESEHIEHGEIGYQIFLKEIVPHLDLTIDEVKSVSMAIKYHNKMNIKKDYSKSINLIRDADKIDILYIIANDKSYLQINEDEDISKKVHDEFFHHHLINKNDINTTKDKIISFLAFIWDINNRLSAQMIKENKYYSKIQEILNIDIFDEYFEEINKVLRRFNHGSKI